MTKCPTISASIRFIIWSTTPAISSRNSTAHSNVSVTKTQGRFGGGETGRPRHGVGIGCFVETSGIGPWEYARVEIDNAGKVVLYSGCNSVGQGIATALSQIVADELQVSIDEVRVVHGDTAQVPYGNGSNASRSTVMAGSAAVGHRAK